VGGNLGNKEQGEKVQVEPEWYQHWE
jgi:hypothetical protein